MLTAEQKERLAELRKNYIWSMNVMGKESFRRSYRAFSDYAEEIGIDIIEAESEAAETIEAGYLGNTP